jgi:hypothetical protein
MRTLKDYLVRFRSGEASLHQPVEPRVQGRPPLLRGRIDVAYGWDR